MADRAFEDIRDREFEQVHGSDPDEDWWARELTPGYSDEYHRPRFVRKPAAQQDVEDERDEAA